MAPTRNPYEQDVDFSVLALQSPGFNKYLKQNGQLDFSNPEAVKALTIALLKRDFDLKLALPDDRLCPPVPNRLNYILWIQDLIDSTSGTYTDEYDPEREVTGLDIGTGSSCIYPLLGCATRPSWRFVATDIDEKNLTYARRNILANSFQTRIRPYPSTPTSPLIPLSALSLPNLDFTLCNPPFYASLSELATLAKAKSRPPNSACTGAAVEMVTEGGEAAFVKRMVDESLVLGEKVGWYSSMLGKKESVGDVVGYLREKAKERLGGPQRPAEKAGKGEGTDGLNFAVREMVQGGKTRRWGVAWSWGDLRPGSATSRGLGSLPKHLLPFPPEYTFAISTSSTSISTSASPTATPLSVLTRINSHLVTLPLQWRFRPSLPAGIGLATKNVWSRSARRRANTSTSVNTKPPRDEDAMDESRDSEQEEEVALGFKIAAKETVLYESGGSGASACQGKGDKVVEVEVKWVRGTDSVLFESFCGMLRRVVGA